MGHYTNKTRMPLGWYPDPNGAGGYRWWNGVEWTAQVVDRPPNVAA